jgi:formylglycine-generating enzyme required for sulfatase activity
MDNTGGKLNVFLCYRQVDGKETASWLYETLNGLSVTEEAEDQDDGEVLNVYFDQTAPAVSDWHAIHQPALIRARAMIFVCSPGARSVQGEDDWVHNELNWWIKNRRAAPILIDPTGQGERWVPESIRSRWPNAQRVEVRVAEWERLPDHERSRHLQRVTNQVVRGIRLSGSSVIDDVLRAKRKEILRLRVLICLLMFAVALAIWSIHRQRLLISEMLPYSDSQQLSDLNEKANETLWPANERNAPQMKEWLERAQELLSRLEVHKSALYELRKYAEKQGPASATSWAFSDIRNQWEHDLLSKLVQGLDKLASSEDKLGTIKEMKARLEFARTVRRKTVEEHAGEWQAAINAISSSDIYHGLRLKPQAGLVPIGPDPESKLWEFSHLQTGEVVRRGPDGKLVLKENSGLVFVLLPGGKFWMGSQKQDQQQPNYDPYSKKDESPVNQVELSPFFISKYEMTQGQWLSLTKENPSLYHPSSQLEGGGYSLLHPVEQVSWEDCVRVLSHIEAQLPTEAQWEYAARASSSDPWYTGKDYRALAGAANLADQTAAKAGKVWMPKQWPELNDGSIVHASVGTYRPNRFGLYDIYGNLWEWCKELQGSYTVPARPGDGERPTPGSNDQFMRVRRGGAFTYGPMEARSAFRTNAQSNYRTLTTGVRPVKQLD